MAAEINELSELVQRWRDRAKESHEEAGRIRRTTKAATGAEDRCNVRGDIWHECANELICAMGRIAFPLPPPAGTDPLRRDRLYQMTEAEKTIFDAVAVVERAGNHKLLTEAVNLLHAARNRVADFVDLSAGKPPFVQEVGEQRPETF